MASAAAAANSTSEAAQAAMAFLTGIKEPAADRLG
jgi:hypothetical protein